MSAPMCPPAIVNPSSTVPSTKMHPRTTAIRHLAANESLLPDTSPALPKYRLLFHEDARTFTEAPGGHMRSPARCTALVRTTAPAAAAEPSTEGAGHGTASARSGQPPRFLIKSTY